MTTHRDIHTYIAELTRPTTHREPYNVTDDNGTTWTRHHTVTTPSLIDQLANPISENADRNGGTYTFGPSTPAHIEALDTLQRIDNDAAAHLRRLGHDDPGDTTTTITTLGSLHPNLNDTAQSELEHAVRTWWTAARVSAGWDQPQWRPDNTCPHCETRGTLRIRRDATGALCIHTECRTVWHEDTVGLLAEHIRLENREDQEETA